MAKVLVSIISENLIPNYHLYLHLKNSIDKHLLISTTKMNDDGYLSYFLNFINEDSETILLEDFRNFNTIIKNLNIVDFNDTDEYIINITGGTKVISLAVFNHFRMMNSKMYYVAIGTNSCQNIYPKQEEPETFKHDLVLEDYLGLYGFSIEKSNKLYKNPSETKNLFKKVQYNEYNALSVAEIREAFTNANSLNSEDVKYLKGLWFEEYIYNLFKEKLYIKDTQIALNVKVKRNKEQKSIDNEFDVMFVKNNKLYVIECKSSIGKKKEHKKNIESYLYKLAAIIKDMGLQVNPILAIAGNIAQYNSVINRAEILKILTIGAEKFENKKLLDIFIKLL